MDMQDVTIVLLTLLIYCVPIIVSYMRAHNNLKAIVALDLLTAWTGVGWIAALVWSLTDNVAPPVTITQYIVDESEESATHSTRDLVEKK